jgi:alpha-mannosidase
MRRICLLLELAILSLSSLNAQSFLTVDDYLINGYSKKITGLDYDYQSCIPGLRESMLLRATSGKDFIEWETDPVPSHIMKKYATFIWVAALGSSPGRARMDMTVSGKQNFSFYTDGMPAWEVKSVDGSSLSFNSIMVDQHGDNHGYMILRIPANSLNPGNS